MKHILIVDDHLMVAQSIGILLDSSDTNLKTHSLGSIAKTIKALDEGKTYDLILLDQEMPEMKGIEGLELIMQKYPDQIVGMISGITDTLTIRKAIAKGAVGWIPKSMSGAPLVHAVRTMVEGGKFIPSEILEKIFEHYDKLGKYNDVERKIIERLIMGLSDKEIGLELDIPYRTVQHHVRNILKKSDYDNRTKFALSFKD